MATHKHPSSPHPSQADDKHSLESMLVKVLDSKNVSTSSVGTSQGLQQKDPGSSPSAEGLSRKVVSRLPRTAAFDRQDPEVQYQLEANEEAERRAVAADRQDRHPLPNPHSSEILSRASTPDFLDENYSVTSTPGSVSVPASLAMEEKVDIADVSIFIDPSPKAAREAEQPSRANSPMDMQTTTVSLCNAHISEDLDRKWILNLSMRFVDKSQEEKFFVTYIERDSLWRRVTISLDYRDAPKDSLEEDLAGTSFQREKSVKVYQAIRESLPDIQFYGTITNLKLQTIDGRLNIHVMEDASETIHFPILSTVQHLSCPMVREKDIEFDSHICAFTYKVQINGRRLIKKEIPGPDTVDSFLYEINALSSLRFSSHLIHLYGVVIDHNQHVKGLLTDYVEQRALVDVICSPQEYGLDLPWSIREKWARQIVQGLSDIHETGFVHGNLTLSSIVIDDEQNTKLIDISQQGYPVGWEPPEAPVSIDNNLKTSMYIGIKSDLYQLGMVLWALATLEDEPEAQDRPLRLDPGIEVPRWFHKMAEICLIEDPRFRIQATALLDMFPKTTTDQNYDGENMLPISIDNSHPVQQCVVDSYEQNGRPVTESVPSPNHSYYPGGVGYQSGLNLSGFPDEVERLSRAALQKLDETIRQDVKFEATTLIHGCWTCIPSKDVTDDKIPLTIDSLPVIIPVESQYKLLAPSTPPPDPYPDPIIPGRMVTDEIIDAIFQAYTDALGFYLLLNGRLQLVVPDDFDSNYSLLHKPHMFGGLKVSYIRQSVMPTARDSEAKGSPATAMREHPHNSLRRDSRIIKSLRGTGAQQASKNVPGDAHAEDYSLRIGSSIYVLLHKGKSKKNFEARLGLKTHSMGRSFVTVPTHILNDALIHANPKSSIVTSILSQDLMILAGEEKFELGAVTQTFDPDAQDFPWGYEHDVSLVDISHLAPKITDGIKSPLQIDWVTNHEWSSIQLSSTKLVLLHDIDRDVKSIDVSTSRCQIVGQGVFRTQQNANDWSLRETLNITKPNPPLEKQGTRSRLVAKAVLYRVNPKFQDRFGQSGTPVCLMDKKQDGTPLAKVAGFTSFVQPVYQVQKFDTEGGQLEKRLDEGKVAFYGAFLVPEALRNEHVIV